jgi:alpha-tubulin suppressor-like RCC1 family protein
MDSPRTLARPRHAHILIALITSLIALGLWMATSAHASSTSITDISAAGGHTCAIVAGEAWCWGDNTFGQLGNGEIGAAASTTTPVKVIFSDPATRLKDVAVGVNYSCAVDLAGAAWCWGNNEYAKLGDFTNPLAPGDSNQPASPQPIKAKFTPPAPVLTEISASLHHTCALDATGGGWCWGTNEMGELGENSQDNTPHLPLQPVDSGDLPRTGISAIRARGDQTCAIIDGAAECWGQNDGGQLGVDPGTYPFKLLPTPVYASDLGSGLLGITTGHDHSCAIRADSTLWCWGDSANGELGDDNAPTGSWHPVQVVTAGGTPLTGVSAVTGGHHYSCAVAGGGAWCWGSNMNGKLGDGSDQQRSVATPVVGLSSGVTAITGGMGHTCVLADGAAECWGTNSKGQIGDGSTTARWTPQVVLKAPAVSIGAPADGTSTTASAATVQISASGAPAPTCTVNGVAAAGTADVALAVGSNTVNVVCTNLVGSASKAITLTRIGPPAITAAPKRVKLGRAIKLKVSCASGCTITPHLKIGKKKIKGVKKVKVKAGQRHVTIRLPKKVVAQIKRALKKNKKTKITLKLTPKSPAAAGKAKTIRIR